MLTQEDYVRITGDSPPDDFCSCVMAAKDTLDSATLYAYIGVDIDKLPQEIALRYKRALALQTQAVSMAGGAAAMHDMQMNSASLGKYAYTVNNSGNAEGTSSGALSPAVVPLIPLLVAYGRGLRTCGRSR